MNEVEELDLNNPFPEPFEMEITDTLDLHAFSPKDVKSVVETYLFEARERNFRTVRIVHGKGDGILRTLIRNHLRGYKQVAKTQDENADRGGAGVTLVSMK